MVLPRRDRVRFLLLTLLLASAGDVAGARHALADQAAQTLVAAGCDANVPITSLLARAFRRQRPDIVIGLRSVGSTNGVALAAAGAVQIGLLSRPLLAGEEGLGLTYRAYARTAVIIGADPDVPDVTLRATDLLRIYRSGLRWSTGDDVVLLTREQGDSGVTSLKDRLPGFAEAYAAGAATGRWTVLYSEQAMHEALLTFPFALGLSDLGTVTIERLPIRVLSIDGVAPTLDNLAHGRYPFSKTLGLVWREETLGDAARAFVRFLASDEAAGILTSHGYLPVR
jgi:phosphate transport system substrate-binding protein